jgi:hypothetical protein
LAEAGVRPQYLSGEDEARLIYLAVDQWYGWSAGRLLIWEGALRPPVRDGAGSGDLLAAARHPPRPGAGEAEGSITSAQPREGIILHYLQDFNQSCDLPLRPLNGSTYSQDAPGGRHVTLVTTSSGPA